MLRKNSATHYAEYADRFKQKIRFCAHGDPCTHCCWDWAGGIKNNGYGQFFIGRYNDKVTMVHAHRFAYQLFKRQPEPGALLLHSCDRRCCVNPSHLREGTQQDNIKDAIARGSIKTGKLHHFAQQLSRKGADVGTSKLTNEDIDRIYEMRFRGDRIATIAASFPLVTVSTIKGICSGQRWRHLYPIQAKSVLGRSDAFGRKHPRKTQGGSPLTTYQGAIWRPRKEAPMPDYTQMASLPILCPPDADPQAPALWEPLRPWERPDIHQHSWGTDLYCTGCGWSYYAVLARAKAQKEQPCT